MSAPYVQPFVSVMRRRSLNGLLAALATITASAITLANEPTREPQHKAPRTAVAAKAHGQSNAAVPFPASKWQTLGAFQGRSESLKRGVQLVMSADANAQARHTSMLPVGARGNKIPVEIVFVQQGRADAILGKGPPRGVMMQSEDQVQAISTEGRVAFQVEADRIIVAALEGSVLVGKGGMFKPLSSGEIRVFDRVTQATTNTSLLSAPTLASAGLGVALTGPAEIPVPTTNVQGAARYRIAVVDERGDPIGQVTEFASAKGVVARVERAGAYWVVARAVDEYGFAGKPSKPVPLRVLGLEPGDEVIRQGLIFLAPGQSAKLRGQNGLLMRYGNSSEYVPAPAALGLPPGRRATTVEFRDPNDPAVYALLRLAPTVLRTRIHIGSGTSSWPGAPMPLSVHIWDGNGKPLASLDEYRVVVRVGLEEIPVEWTPSQGGLHAELPSQPGPGPWVVRVSILDPTGDELARDFMEVSSKAPRQVRDLQVADLR